MSNDDEPSGPPRKKAKTKRRPVKPGRLLVFENKDKKWHEGWEDGQDLCNLPHPFRWCLIGPPGSGKTSVAHHIVACQHPPFEEIMIAHVDGSYSQEWDDADPSAVIGAVPDYRQLKGTKKTLIVFEDFELTGLSKIDRARLSRLLGYASTHKNLSILMLQQDPSAVPPIARRMCDGFVMWKSLDNKILDLYGSKMGLGKGKLEMLFNTHCHNKHDAIWLDHTHKSPAKVRLNGYEKLDVF